VTEQPSDAVVTTNVQVVTLNEPELGVYQRTVPEGLLLLIPGDVSATVAEHVDG